MTEPLRIGVAGLGTVGGGLIDLLRVNGALVARRGGRSIEVVAVSARDRNRDRGFDISGYDWYDDPVEMARGASIDVFVELIGGSSGSAKDACEAAFHAGRHVVTANKALLAEHGTALATQAEAAGVILAYEAAVAGGIPIVKAIREGLAGNRLSSLHGILNGTCNYILTAMRDTGRPFADILAEAQALGYAEADPTFDVDGIDAAHKLALLASLAFGTRVDFANVHIEGIRQISAEDFIYAKEFGFAIKLLGIAEEAADGVRQRVHPTLVPLHAPVAAVEDVFNAIVTEGDCVGMSVFEGRGAGAGPTASAVAADLCDIAAGRGGHAFGVPATALTESRSLDMSGRHGGYYVRMRVLDRPGVIAEVTAILRDEDISMESIIQRGRDPGEPVDVVLILHETHEDRLTRALNSIAELDSIREKPYLIRIEHFGF